MIARTMDTVDYNEVQTLCRVCLTKRPNMTPLTDEIDHNESLSILETLEQVMSQKVTTRMI